MWGNGHLTVHHYCTVILSNKSSQTNKISSTQQCHHGITPKPTTQNPKPTMGGRPTTTAKNAVGYCEDRPCHNPRSERQPMYNNHHSTYCSSGSRGACAHMRPTSSTTTTKHRGTQQQQHRTAPTPAHPRTHHTNQAMASPCNSVVQRTAGSEKLGPTRMAPENFGSVPPNGCMESQG
jgi:hypothetical protein